MRRRLHISKGPLSLGVPSGRHGFRNILLSDYLRRSICSVPCRTTAFRCHSFSAGGKAIEPAIKAVTLVLTKSHGLIQQFPLVYKLVPVVALLVFSLWGLVPLVRQGRNLLLNGIRSCCSSYCISRLIQQIQKLFSETSDPNDTRNMRFEFVGKAMYSAESLGFSRQKWLTGGRSWDSILITLVGERIAIRCKQTTNHPNKLYQ